MNILFATDGSEKSKEALKFCARIAGKKDKISVLHVVPLLVGDFRMTTYDTQKTLEKEAKEILGEAVAFFKKKKLKTKRILEYGIAGEVIVDKSKGHDLVILGSHGKTGLERLLLGSVSEFVVKNSHVSVLVVK